MMRIIVEAKTVYGTDFIYPVCDKAKAVAAMLQTKTLPERVLPFIESLGFEIVFFDKRNTRKLLTNDMLTTIVHTTGN